MAERWCRPGKSGQVSAPIVHALRGGAQVRLEAVITKKESRDCSRHTIQVDQLERYLRECDMHPSGTSREPDGCKT